MIKYKIVPETTVWCTNYLSIMYLIANVCIIGHEGLSPQP